MDLTVKPSFRAPPCVRGPIMLPKHFGSRTSRMLGRPTRVCEDSNRVQVAAVQESPEPLYLEPFLRAFLLGLGSGALLETVHVGLQFLGVLPSLGASGVIDAVELIEAQPTLLEHFAPLFYADHVAAVAGWLAFYLIDVLAIKAVLELYKGDATAAGSAIANLVTIPKKMLPLRLAIFKHIYAFPTAAPALGGAETASAAVAASTPVDPDGIATTEMAISDATVQAPTRAPGIANIVPTAPPPTLDLPGVAAPPRKGLRPGQMSPDSQTFLKRAKELADRRSYLHGFWYAAALSENVKPGKPFGVDILGRRLVLFREADTGTVRCLDDACPHRGAPLSAGWMNKVDGHDCVVCPYHGWAIEGESGRLLDVPAAEHKGEWPKRSIVPAHTVKEQGGFVWLFYGPKNLPEDARPPIPYAPELDDPSWKAVYGEIEFECNHHGVFENAIDMAHIHYLHSDSFGNQGKPEIRDMTAEVDAFSVTAKFKLHNKPVSPLWEWTKVPEVEVTAKAFLPSTSMITFTLGAGLSFTTFVNTVPVGPNKTVNRFALVRNLAWDKTGAFNAGAWDSWARKAMLRILGEDKEMVERLRPELLGQEYSVRADLPQVAFRKLRQQYIDMGYGRASDRNLPPELDVKPDF